MVNYRRLEHSKDKFGEQVTETCCSSKADIQVLGRNYDITGLTRKLTRGGLNGGNSNKKAGPLECNDKRKKNHTNGVTGQRNCGSTNGVMHSCSKLQK